MTIIKELHQDKGQVCKRILESLPIWFGIEKAILDYALAIESMPMFVIENQAGEILAFLALDFHNEFNAEIHVMAVLPDFHGKGLGTALVEKAKQYSKAKGLQYLTVKTMSPSKPNREYDLTRKFYQKLGFVPLEEFKTLWSEANPCLLMIKNL